MENGMRREEIMKNGLTKEGRKKAEGEVRLPK